MSTTISENDGAAARSANATLALVSVAADVGGAVAPDDAAPGRAAAARAVGGRGDGLGAGEARVASGPVHAKQIEP